MVTPAATPDIRLAAMDLPPILSSASIGRLPPAAIPDLIAAAHTDPDPANLYMRMFYLLQALGQQAFALDMQAKALERRCLYRIAGAPDPAIRLLALLGPGDMTDNTPLEFVVDNSDIRLDLLFLSPHQPLPEVIPDHDVAIVVVSESDKNRALLAHLETLLAAWPRPLLNPPQHIKRCARDTVCRLLNGIPGLLVPATRRLERAQIHGARLPLTLRPIDTHAGKGLAKVETEAELDAYCAAHADAEFFVADYADYRSADGLYHKLRVVLIDGKPYICHLAIADDWMVHYLSAGMQLSEPKRAEEAALMASFDDDFAVRHGVAFAAIAAGLGLDYVVLDCGEMRDGRLLLFEADVGGWIHATDPVEVFPYKPAAMQKAFDAFRTMLTTHSAR